MFNLEPLQELEKPENIIHSNMKTIAGTRETREYCTFHKQSHYRNQRNQRILNILEAKPLQEPEKAENIVYCEDKNTTGTREAREYCTF